MPKVVDAGERRTDVADALFRIAVRDGLHRASLREVAKEAQLNVGSVRHYFADQADLLVFAMRTMIDRVSARLRERFAALADPPSRTLAERVDTLAGFLEELLPLDERRHAEVVVFLEFGVAARVDPVLAGLAAESAAGTDALVRRVLATTLDPGRDVDVEARRLTALLDGLAMAGTRPAVAATTDGMRNALRAHLYDVCAPPRDDPQAAARSSSGRRW